MNNKRWCSSNDNGYSADGVGIYRDGSIQEPAANMRFVNCGLLIVCLVLLASCVYYIGGVALPEMKQLVKEFRNERDEDTKRREMIANVRKLELKNEADILLHQKENHEVAKENLRLGRVLRDTMRGD